MGARLLAVGAALLILLNSVNSTSAGIRGILSEPPSGAQMLGARAAQQRPPRSLAGVFLSDPRALQETVEAVGRLGGRVVHVVARQLLVVELQPAQDTALMRNPQVERVARQRLDLQAAPGVDPALLRIWNRFIAMEGVESAGDAGVQEAPPIWLASPEPSSTATSEFLIGAVVVSVIHPYCDGSGGACLEAPFSQSELDDIQARAMQAMDFWAGEEPDAHLTFFYEPIKSVGIPTDPTAGCLPAPDGCYILNGPWRDETMTALGYGGTNAFTQERQYLDDLRHGRPPATSQGWDADWAFIAYVPRSTPGRRAYAYVGGPSQVDWNGDSVSTIAHETGHTFYAGDEYSSVDRWPWQGCQGGALNCRWGYLGRVMTGNRRYGFVDEISLMSGGLTGVSTYARAAIGWSNSDSAPAGWGADQGPAAGSRYSHVVAADFNADLISDLAAIDVGPNEIELWLSNGRVEVWK